MRLLAIGGLWGGALFSGLISKQEFVGGVECFPDPHRNKTAALEFGLGVLQGFAQLHYERMRCGGGMISHVLAFC